MPTLVFHYTVVFANTAAENSLKFYPFFFRVILKEKNWPYMMKNFFFLFLFVFDEPGVN